MNLGTKQAEFTACLAVLITWAVGRSGVRLRLREVTRFDWVASTMAFFGRGVKRSTHVQSLAADLILDLWIVPEGGAFNDGKWVYQTDSEAYAFLGKKWKTLSTLARWGGDFRPSRDGNHFSFEHRGVK